LGLAWWELGVEEEQEQRERDLVEDRSDLRASTP
jgi:hypothetical protein